jgi:hypothetical protein
VSLQRLLTWSEDDEDLETYRSAFLRKAEARLVAAIHLCGAQGHDTGALLAGVLEDLPPARVLHVACAPQLEFLVRDTRASAAGGAALAQFLADSLQVELRLQDATLAREALRPVWSALGDRRLGPAGGHDGTGDEPDGASMVGSGIPLDFRSPYHRGDLPFRFPDHASYDGPSSRALAGKIEAAYTLVLAVGPRVARFVASFTSVIVPLQVAGASRWFGSFSSSWYPGRSVLVNAHLDEMRAPDIAAALVHEAIHSLIDVSELDGRLLSELGPPAAKVQSPWTGASISLQSLLDAYFVWYGLLFFWKKVAAEPGGIAASLTEQSMDRCRPGVAPAVEEVVRDTLPAVHPFARESIESLRVAVARELAGAEGR